MSTPVRIPVTFGDSRGRAPFPVCFTPEAYRRTLETVGARRPESGAKGFAPAGKIGFEVVEFDERGSADASGSIYSPDEVWGAERCRFWESQAPDEAKLWTGDVHSHPGYLETPSRKSGTGLGDLGYAEETLRRNPWMRHFLMPIVVGSGGYGRPRIVPWVIDRESPETPLRAELEVCPVEHFPAREFPTDWDQDEPVATGWPLPVDLDRLERLLEAPIRVGLVELELEFPGATLVVSMTAGFPVDEPELFIVRPNGSGASTPLPVRWRQPRDGDPGDVEARLAKLCLAVRDHWSLTY